MKNNTQKSDPLAKRVLGRITDEHLTPRPRWEFLFKNYLFWGLGALAVLLGALAFSAMIFEIENVDWRLAPVTHGSFFSFFFDAAPLLWVSALGLFLLLGYVNVRRTSHGYRYPLAIIALGAILTSLALGSALYLTGLGSVVEEVVGDYPPFHRPILLRERSWWLSPGKGLLGGHVVSVAPGLASFELLDFNGTLWRVDGNDLRNHDLATVARGGVVRVVGVPTAATSSEFHACFVLPWEFHGDFGQKTYPLPLALIASTSERSSSFVRSEACKGIRPYQQLRNIDTTGF
ncbi:MAG: hypothetical protein ACYCZZ_02545 [Minisyncoccota bacterium]